MDSQQVTALMESCQSSQEWNDNCDKVKAAFDGNYPDFWFDAILQSGLARRVMARWGSDPDFIIAVPGHKPIKVKNEAAK